MQNKILTKFLWLYIICATVAACFVYGIIAKANGDNVEHLHSSWLIWQGYVPYRDFFQHHNPLTWYLAAPFVALLINQFMIFSIFNIFSILAVCLMVYFQCRIMLVNGGKKISALFWAACVVTSYSVLWALNFRPDTFMYLCLFAGILCLCRYVREKALWLLVMSFLCFFLAFMFTQKVLLNLIVPGSFVLYWLLKGNIGGKDFLQACILPVLLFAVFAAYLYYNDALSVYWYANFPFNARIPDIFEHNRITFPPREYFEFYIFVPLGSIAAAYFVWRGNAVERMISFMFVEEALLRMFYFSAFLHYSIFWLILAMMLTVMFLDKIPVGRKVWAAAGIIYLLFSAYYNYEMTYKKELPNHKYQNGHEYAFYNLTPCDYALNGYYSVYNLKAKDAGYYSVLLGQIDVLGEKTGIRPRDNLNELIRTKRPKIISAGIYWDTYWEQRGKKIPAHRLDTALIDLYYEYSGIGDIYILKPEYQKHDCRYNGKTWEYAD